MTAPVDQAVEAAAKLIYETWKDIPEYRLWQNGGNSLKQDEARRIARQVIELVRQQEVAAPVGVVSVSPLHVGVGWVGGYVPKNGEKLYLAAARVPVASPAEPVGVEAAEHGQLDPRTATASARQFLAYVEAYNGEKFSPVFDSPDRQNLAMALDHLQEAGAMILNLAERVPTANAKAAELAWRDMEIDRLKAIISQSRAQDAATVAVGEGK